MEYESENDPAFSLSKWYLDGVDNTGHVALGYSARLNWHKLNLHYTGLLAFAGSGVMSVNSFISNEIPEFRDKATKWASRRLQIKGIWRSLDAPIESKLIESDNGAIHWCCYQPRARVELFVNREPLLRSGMGYVEKLEMTIKPWKLPFNELHWGRYLSDSETIVWISWSGESYLNICFYNGMLMDEFHISDKDITLAHNLGKIVFDNRLILRKGRSLSEIINEIPRLQSKLPGRIANLYECKWRSRGTRILNGKVLGSGWTIHEVIRW